MYFVEKTKGINYAKQFDYPLFAAVLLLSVIGIVALKSAIGDPGITGTWLKQLICLFIGIVIAITISAIDYKDFKTLGIIFYIASIMMLVLVLFIGDERNGSKSWLPVPVINSFQPSELAKVAFAVVVPIFLERLKDGKDIGKNVFKLLVYSMLPIGLVLLQPDVGTAMVFIFSLIAVLFVYGIPYKFFLMAIGAFAAAAPVLWFFILPMDGFRHIRDRIMTFIFPETDLLGKGLQVYRSKMTIGSGQLFGKGLFHGIQTQNSSSVSSFSVPEKQTDFIFSVIGEELGFIGSILVIALIFFILFRCIYIAINSRDAYGSYMVIFIASMFAFHFIENIGMCIGVLPVTGIPLPFVSQGSSSLVTNYINIGILLSVSMRRRKTIFNSSP
ncbi:MAG TPA: FtsW/RodA/SpoVE family cell cycle protein [Clostridia bacterium]|nr:FtsW/RodA/SpoVE family cell cycle protein [Clostridia bacterium]